MDDRARHLLRDLPRTAKVIEIGPSLNPLAPKREGWDVTIVDHATREGLVAKYRHDPAVDPDVIEEVDLVSHGGPVHELLPRDAWGTYDAFIASHVIEHTTDVVSFLRSARILLKDAGVVILAVPDKRKCFDLYRPLSTTGDAVAAYLEKRTRHTATTHFDYCMYQAQRNGATGWTIGEQAPALLLRRIGDGLAAMALAEGADYVDAHAWTFTPSSFELMILELRALGLLQLAVERVCEAVATEFAAWLRPCEELEDEDTIHRYRQGLLDRIVVEQAECARQVPSSAMSRLERARADLRGALAGVLEAL